MTPSLCQGCALVWESYKLEPYVQRLAEMMVTFQEKADDLLADCRQEGHKVDREEEQMYVCRDSLVDGTKRNRVEDEQQTGGPIDDGRVAPELPNSRRDGSLGGWAPQLDSDTREIPQGFQIDGEDT